MIRSSLMSDAAFAAFLLNHSVSGGKDDSTISAQEAQQNGFNKQLAAIFGTQFGKQSSVLNFLTNKLTGMAENPTGFDATTKAALNTGNIEGAAKSFSSAQKATQAIEAGRGGSTLPSGVSEQLTAENANAGAAQLSEGERQIALADAAQKQDNQWRALSGLSSIAAEENPTPYASEYNQGSATVGNLAVDKFDTSQSPLAAILGGVAGTAIKTIGAYYSGKGGDGGGGGQ